MPQTSRDLELCNGMYSRMAEIQPKFSHAKYRDRQLRPSTTLSQSDAGRCYASPPQPQFHPAPTSAPLPFPPLSNHTRSLPQRRCNRDPGTLQQTGTHPLSVRASTSTLPLVRLRILICVLLISQESDPMVLGDNRSGSGCGRFGRREPRNCTVVGERDRVGRASPHHSCRELWGDGATCNRVSSRVTDSLAEGAGHHHAVAGELGSATLSSLSVEL